MRTTVVVLGLMTVFFATGPGRAGEDPEAERLSAVVREIASDVEKATGLRFKSLPAVDVGRRKQVAELLRERVLEHVGKERLAALDMLDRRIGFGSEDEAPPPDDPGNVVRMLGEHIAGLYDPRSRTLLLVRESLLPTTRRLVIAHELVHALQDQHFGLAQLIAQRSLTLDESLARRAVVEGQATAVSLNLGGLMGKMSLLEIRKRPGDDSPLEFVYLRGARFVGEMKAVEGWQTFAEQLARLPLSTEQVLHPVKMAGVPDVPTRVELPDMGDVVSPDYVLKTEETLGELSLRSLLLLKVDSIRAVRASTGWDGDRIRVFEHRGTGKVGLVWALCFDTPEDGPDFADTWREIAAREKGGDVVRGSERGVVVVRGFPADLAPRIARRVLEFRKWYREDDEGRKANDAVTTRAEEKRVLAEEKKDPREPAGPVMIVSLRHADNRTRFRIDDGEWQFLGGDALDAAVAAAKKETPDLRGMIDPGPDVPHAHVIRAIDAFVKAQVTDIAFWGSPRSTLPVRVVLTNETAAIIHLRNLSSAQAQFQACAFADGDNDGTGEFGTMGELCGAADVRMSGRKCNPPVLSEKWSQSLAKDGIAIRAGYRFAVLLPGPEGKAVLAKGWEPLDPKAVATGEAEGRWCAFAWPQREAETGRRTFFVSQTGDVWSTDGANPVVPDLEKYPMDFPPKDGNTWKRVP